MKYKLINFKKWKTIHAMLLFNTIKNYQKRMHIYIESFTKVILTQI